MKICSYRGEQKEYPENTLLAFREAILAGAEAIALDVHMTKDRIPVIFQDDSLGRMVDGIGLLRHHTLEEVQSYRFNDPFANVEQQIPTIDEYLSWADKLPHRTVLMLKNEQFFYPHLEEELMKRLDAFEGLDRVIVASARLESLRQFHMRYPEVKLAWMSDQLKIDRVERLKELDIKRMMVSAHAVTRQMVALCRENGFYLDAVDVRTSKQVERLDKLMIDGIFTTDVSMARQTLGMERMPFTPEQLAQVEIEEKSPEDEKGQKTQIQILAQHAKELSANKGHHGKGNIFSILIAMAICVTLATVLTSILMNVLKNFFH